MARVIRRRGEKTKKQKTKKQTNQKGIQQYETTKSAYK